MPDLAPNVLPLTRPQWSALIAATSRELGWGLRAVSREIGMWRRRARAIPDPTLQRDALHAIDHKRGHVDGAAMFWTLPQRQDPSLLRVLVRYELLQDFLDTVTEPEASLGPTHGEQLYLALGDALDTERPVSNYYLHHRSHDDAGYLDSLVRGCRYELRTLPGYPAVRPLLLREVDRASVLLINHLPDHTRDAALRRWSEAFLPHEHELTWFERTAAASGWITTHALIAAAADPAMTPDQAAALHAAYFPWLALTLTMLDSYADQTDDHRTGSHSYIAHYDSTAQGVARLSDCIDRASRSILGLPYGERHAVLLGCMIALYLSKDRAREPDLIDTTKFLTCAGGRLPRMLLPILRAWRICNRQQAST